MPAGDLFPYDDSAKTIYPSYWTFLSIGRFLHMRKKTIVILFSVGFSLYFLGAISIGIAAVILGTAQQGCMPNCDPTSATGMILMMVISSMAALVGYILFMVAWVATLVKQAQRKQWAWFVCTLLFSSICMLIWLIVEPEVAQYVVPLYQPVQPMGMSYPSGYPYPPTPSYSPEAQYYQQQELQYYQQQESRPHRAPQE